MLNKNWMTTEGNSWNKLKPLDLVKDLLMKDTHPLSWKAQKIRPELLEEKLMPKKLLESKVLKKLQMKELPNLLLLLLQSNLDLMKLRLQELLKKMKN